MGENKSIGGFTLGLIKIILFLGLVGYFYVNPPKKANTLTEKMFQDCAWIHLDYPKKHESEYFKISCLGEGIDSTKYNIQEYSKIVKKIWEEQPNLRNHFPDLNHNGCILFYDPNFKNNINTKCIDLIEELRE